MKKKYKQFDLAVYILPVGEKHWASKLTDADVLAIRADSRSLRKLAQMYNVSNPTIWSVKQRRSWKHV